MSKIRKFAALLAILAVTGFGFQAYSSQYLSADGGCCCGDTCDCASCETCNCDGDSCENCEGCDCSCCDK